MAEAKIQFTPAQAAAIQARGGSLLVSAAAGSGKTRVLVERVAGLITDPDHPVDADSLLIMTFTNAAAAKLRADITKRLAAEIRQHPQDVRLRRQQMRLQRASIGTVDAFCLHFVQQNFSALDVPPDFTIADDATLVRLQQETLSTVLEQAYTDPDFCAFADLYDRGRTDDTTGRAVQELYHFTQALPHPAQALQRFVEMWQSDAPPEKTQWGQAVLRETSARIKGVLRLLRAAQKIAAKDPAADKALTAVLMDDEDRILLVLDHGAWDTVPEALDNADNWRRAGRVPGGIASNIAAMSANMLRDRAKKHIATLRTDFLLCPAADYQADRRRAAPLVAALVRAVEQYRRTLLEAKLAEKVLDYADLEHMTLELLLTPDCAAPSARGTLLCWWTNTRIPTRCRMPSTLPLPRRMLLTCFLWGISSRAFTVSARRTPPSLWASRRRGSPTRPMPRYLTRNRPPLRWMPTSAVRRM